MRVARRPVTAADALLCCGGLLHSLGRCSKRGARRHFALSGLQQALAGNTFAALRPWKCACRALFSAHQAAQNPTNFATPRCVHSRFTGFEELQSLPWLQSIAEEP